jgi:hypothetical protein
MTHAHRRPDADSTASTELDDDRRTERRITYKGVAAALLTAAVIWVRQRYLL